LTQQEIIEKENRVIGAAINKQALPPSWKDATMSKATLNQDDEEWKVKFNNPKVDDNKDLFIFFSLDGNYIVMNHTGS
jgi:hypothetical protein|tara:strand:+ start:39149 stop:39382 length:234 start_codon:yes stop_codon:yes gene_type:complete